MSASKPARSADPDGYTLVELIVAMGLALSMMASALTVLSKWQLALSIEGERVDQQQRLRVLVDGLSSDLASAGAGAALGMRAGALGVSVPSLLPFRQRGAFADPPGVFRPDVLTIISVRSPASTETALEQPLPLSSATDSATAVINLDGCPGHDPPCGFTAGTDAIVYDESGAFETFRVGASSSNVLPLRHTMSDVPKVFAIGARIVGSRTRTYFLKADSEGTLQLVRSDDVGAEVVAADHVVGLTFEYFGEPAPPRVLRTADDPRGPLTSYGPMPPLAGVASSAYPPGENCVFQRDASTGMSAPRLTRLASESSLVALTAAQLTDGPWCPDAASPHRWDADLLRIRRVAVQARLEAAVSALRGPAGPLFARGGTARAANAWLADLVIRFDVAPRNLSGGR